VRSISLFTESIHTKCPFQAIECESYEAFQKGKCNLCNRNNHRCFKFGFHSRKSYDEAIKKEQINSSQPIATYLLTSDKSPFCVSHYNISVKISNTEESRRYNGDIGILYFKMKSRSKTSKKIKFNSSPKYFSPGSIHSHLTTGDIINDIDSVSVTYDFVQTINPLTWRIFTSKIYIEYIVVESMEQSTQQKFCPDLGPDHGIGDKKEAIFKIDKC
jgi:pancreatic triacylglycerol lipase